MHNYTFIVKQKDTIEDALVSKITSACQCTFDEADFHNSSVTCENDGELAYTASVIYANDAGSETALILIERLIGQTPFTMTVNGRSVTATSACSECETAAPLSPASGGDAGPAIAGFVIAAVLALILIVV